MNNKYLINTISLVLIDLGITTICIFYPSLPDLVPIHYNILGEPDGFGV